MPEIEVNIELYCTCGEGLCRHSKATTTRTRNEPMFEIAPCAKCLDSAREEGYDEGHDAGYQLGYAEAEEHLKDKKLD